MYYWQHAQKHNNRKQYNTSTLECWNQVHINNRENKRKKYEKGYYKTHACDEVFVCKNCGREVVPMGAGSDHRNHCPYCLHSVHLDNEPGDREADCGSIMEPIAAWVRNNGEWAIIHRCKWCGTLSSNRIAADDNPVKLMSIAMKPIGNPPFPIERMKDVMERLTDEEL